MAFLYSLIASVIGTLLVGTVLAAVVFIFVRKKGRKVIERYNSRFKSLENALQKQNKRINECIVSSENTIYKMGEVRVEIRTLNEETQNNNYDRMCSEILFFTEHLPEFLFVENIKQIQPERATLIKFLEKDLEQFADRLKELEVKEFKESEMPYLKLGVFYLFLRNYKKSLYYFEKARKLCPENIMVYNNIAVCLYEQKQYEEAKQLLIHALDLDEHYMVLSNMGSLFLALDQLEPAQNIVEKSLQLKETAETVTLLGRIFSKKQLYDEAIECHKRALSLNQDLAMAWNNLGNVYRITNDDTRAKECFSLALDLENNNIYAALQLRDLYYSQNKFSIALQYQKLSLAIDKEKAINWENEIECFKATLDKTPENAGAWYGLGNAYIRNKDLESALVCYKNSVENNLNFAEGWFNLGLTHGRLNHHNDAINAFNKALEINPNYLKAKHALAIAEKINVDK